MTTMLEKAARALAAHFGCEWETMRDADREMIRGYARAVLTAVREPNDDVARQVGRAAWHSGSGVRPQSLCTTMIDSILNEGAAHGQA